MCTRLISKDIEKQYLKFIDKYVLISITDIDGLILYISHAFSKMTGYTQEELIGKTHSILRHPDTNNSVYAHIWQTITKGDVWHGCLKNRTKNNKTYWIDSYIQPIFEDRNIIGYIAVKKNVTEEFTYKKLAKLDSLTGLLNRYAIEEVLNSFLQEAKRYKTPFCIIMIDIDNFKATNDLYGHLAGDKVLKELSSLLTEMLRQSDRIGRWGGEEFMILLPHTTYQQAFNLAERLRKKFCSYTFDTIGHKTASFGIAFYEEGDSLTSITDRVDKALYLAKRNGKNRVS